MDKDGVTNNGPGEMIATDVVLWARIGVWNEEI